MSKVKKLVSRTTCEGKLSAVLTPLYLARGTMQSRVEKQFFEGEEGGRENPIISNIVVYCINTSSIWYTCGLSNCSKKSKAVLFCFVVHRKEQELSESNGNNENLLAQIESLKKKIRELEVIKSLHKDISEQLYCRSQVFVCHSYVLVCRSYVAVCTRMYTSASRMSLRALRYVVL